MWRIEKHPKIWFAVYLGLCLWNTSGVILCDGWINIVCLVAAILTGFFALVIGISIIVAKYSDRKDSV